MFPAYISRSPLFLGVRRNHPGLRRYRPILRPIFLVVRFDIASFIHSNIIQFIRLLCLKDYAGATRVISAFPTCSSDLLSFPAHQPMIFRTSKNNSPCSTS